MRAMLDSGNLVIACKSLMSRFCEIRRYDGADGTALTATLISHSAAAWLVPLGDQVLIFLKVTTTISTVSQQDQRGSNQWNLVF